MDTIHREGKKSAGEGLKSIKPKLVIGIDPGVQTGFAIWNLDKKCLGMVKTIKIHDAFDIIKTLHDEIAVVVVEDARQARFWKKQDYAKAQGAGSVKRDAKIWEDFLTSMDIPFEMRRPSKQSTKWNAKVFNSYTGWEGKSSSHSRDAALMVFNYKKYMVP